MTVHMQKIWQCEKTAEWQRIAAERFEKMSEWRDAAELAHMCRKRETKLAADEARIKSILQKEMQSLQYEFFNPKGLFSSKRRKEIEIYLTKIKEELNTLGE